ncbi:MAG: ABC transporter ATP-binding protein [Verrucomicrobia bacterium]|nr:MAG: ABC transporter ATP-binding protein [Verrucomicrobiota bacterium]
MPPTIITVESLGKKYCIRHQQAGPRDGLRHVLNRWVTAPFRTFNSLRNGHSVADAKQNGQPGRSSQVSGQWSAVSGPSSVVSRPAHEDFWALKNVSFEVKQGEVIGIIGRNGAGKSTLLKILSRITEPTEGRVRIKGRVASLLEVGTGFHPELTGRENVFLNGAILGMSRAEIRKKFDEIVAFAEIEKFLDTPVKRYSSGMYVRLAFAVAAHLEPEILIVDEVLAVGDAEFQRKCLGKMESVAAREGRTVLFVSHNMPAVSRLCQRAYLLDRGEVAFSGETARIVSQYLGLNQQLQSQFGNGAGEPQAGNHLIQLLGVSVKAADSNSSPSFAFHSAIQIDITYRLLKPAPGLRVGFRLSSADGTVIFTSTDRDMTRNGQASEVRAPGVYKSRCRIPDRFLNPGHYSVSVGSDILGGPANFVCDNVVSFSVEPQAGVLDSRADGRMGFICPDLRWEIAGAEGE